MAGLAGLFPDEIDNVLKNAGIQVPQYRTKQISGWILNGAVDFSEMKNIPVSLRDELSKQFFIYSSAVTSEYIDDDGTVKLQITLDDGCVIEAVILRDGKGRKTACVSTQAGCSCSCVFCKTGALGFKRNLRSGEITEQMLLLRNREPEITHIVIMGMGEPLHNLAELRKSINYFTDVKGLGISKKRITISTTGIARGIDDLADNGPDIRLALSLVSARQDIREKLMPAAKENPLPVLKESLKHYQKKHDKRITLEIVLLKGINTNDEEAEATAEFAKSLEVVVNLIPWNPVSGLLLENKTLETPSADETESFIAALEKRKLKVTVRTGKGQGVCGACGQLGSV